MKVPAHENKTAILYVTARGKEVASELAAVLPHSFVIDKTTKIEKLLQGVWKEYQNIVCIMAAGIVVRSVATLLDDKFHDPCVLVIDEKKNNVISLLSGHLGGGNQLTRLISSKIGSNPVITTASDVGGNTALDLWLAKNRMVVNNRKVLTAMSAKLVHQGLIHCYVDMSYLGQLPHDIRGTDDMERADIVITNRQHLEVEKENRLIVYPDNLVLGMGCNRNISPDDIEKSFGELLETYRLKEECFKTGASIDLKINETGMLQFCRKHGLSIRFYSKNMLNGIEGVSSSQAVLKATGAKGVCEPASILAASDTSVGELIIEKQKWQDVTLAVARKKLELQI